jgi:hypothetical protein
MARTPAAYAVMAQHLAPRTPDDLNYFPTPTWAVRAFLAHVLGDVDCSKLTAAEPACGGAGSLARALDERFDFVVTGDVHDYGTGHIVEDFLSPGWSPYAGVDWIITNPPFVLAEQFIHRALELARCGVAMFVRTSFLEGQGRHRDLYSVAPPNVVAIYAERVALVKGRLDQHASTATSYCWLVWRKDARGTSGVVWIPPCRKQFDRADDWPVEVAQ